MLPLKKLTSPEIQALRAKAARGDSISLEETASFVLSYRASFLALPSGKEVKKKEKEKKLETPDGEIDFF
jgi:hypothetical protein